MNRPNHIAQRVVAAARAHDRDQAVIATDAAGVIVYWNEQAASSYGWPRDEVIGRNIVDITPTQTSSEEAAQIMEALRSGEPWRGDFLVRRRDGTPLVMHVVDTPVMDDGTVIGIIGVSRPGRRHTPPPGPTISR